MQDQLGSTASAAQEEQQSSRRFTEIIERIEQVRAYLGLNRSKFCRSIGMSPQTYNNFIGAQGTKPNIQLLHGVVTRFGVDPMWLFTGRGNMFLASADDRITRLSRPLAGVAERGVPYGLGGGNIEAEELTGLMPILQKIEAILRQLDDRNAPLLNRVSQVFKRYLEVNPSDAAAELQAFLERMEQRLAGEVGAGSAATSHP